MQRKNPIALGIKTYVVMTYYYTLAMNYKEIDKYTRIISVNVN